ncbi:hypothetical protein [Yaniella flava]
MSFLLGTWLGLTGLHQISACQKLTARIDPFMHFIPIWTFFGPYPGTTDAEIVTRTFDKNGDVTPWKHLQIFEPRRPLHFLMHRNRRLEKTVFDCSAHIHSMLRNDIPTSMIIASPSYIALLSVVLALVPLPSDTEKIQFMILESSGLGINQAGAVPKFTSAMHDVLQGGSSE